MPLNCVVAPVVTVVVPEIAGRAFTVIVATDELAVVEVPVNTALK